MGPVAIVAGAAAAIAAAAPVQLGAPPGRMTLAVSYAGSGRFATQYAALSPNPGGGPDHNTASDSSTQRWKLHFVQTLAVGQCQGACAPVTLSGATGSERLTGRIDHRHVDGLYRFDDMAAHCRVHYATPAGTALIATAQVAFAPDRRSIVVQLADPLTSGLIGLPTACPGQGDSLDGLLDNYFTPGFSFGSWGPDRWFESRRVTVPLAALAGGRSVSIALHQTRAGTPPRHCDVPAPALMHCRTGGAWTARLTLRVS